MQTDTQNELLSKGYIHRNSIFSEEEKSKIISEVDEISTWPKTMDKWMHYYENKNNDEKMLCRIENFLNYTKHIKKILNKPEIINLLTFMLNDKPIVFKDKINFKLPQGGEYAPHQDAPAFQQFGQKYHVTIMICIDNANLENGCLNFGNITQKDQILKQKSDGTIHEEEISKITWHPLLSKAGDVVLFDSFIPHYSTINNSKKSRRAIFITYNGVSEGDKHTSYYKLKKEYFPPEHQKIPGKNYNTKNSPFNIGNPINGN